MKKTRNKEGDDNMDRDDENDLAKKLKEFFKDFDNVKFSQDEMEEQGENESIERHIMQALMLPPEKIFAMESEMKNRQNQYKKYVFVDQIHDLAILRTKTKKSLHDDIKKSLNDNNESVARDYVLDLAKFMYENIKGKEIKSFGIMNDAESYLKNLKEYKKFDGYITKAYEKWQEIDIDENIESTIMHSTLFNTLMTYVVFVAMFIAINSKKYFGVYEIKNEEAEWCRSLLGTVI
jgi:hypothetical protein